MNILSFDVDSLITCWFRKCLKTTDFSKLINIMYIVVILWMNEVVSGHFYIPKWAGSTSENTFYDTKYLAISDWIGFKKINDGVFEQFQGKHWQIF